MINCDECGGECCKKITFVLEDPETDDDIEDLKWYLYHETIKLYIDDEDDIIAEVPVKCKMLKDGKCIIYEKRPPVCRQAEISDCEANNEDIKVLFKIPEDIDKYFKK